MPPSPVQLLVIGYPAVPGGPVPAPSAPRDATTALAAALEALRTGDAVRLLDYQVVRKDADGSATLLPPEDLRLPAPPAGGATIRTLLGPAGPPGTVPDPRRYLSAGDWYWYLDDAIPPRTTALLVLVEHRWAAPLARALAVRGATLLHDAWVHPGDLPASMTTRDG